MVPDLLNTTCMQVDWRGEWNIPSCQRPPRLAACASLELDARACQAMTVGIEESVDVSQTPITASTPSFRWHLQGICSHFRELRIGKAYTLHTLDFL